MFKSVVTGVVAGVTTGVVVLWALKTPLKSPERTNYQMNCNSQPGKNNNGAKQKDVSTSKGYLKPAEADNDSTSKATKKTEARPRKESSPEQKANGILNKLTMTNMDKLIEGREGLEGHEGLKECLNTMENMENGVNMIVNKVQKQHHFSSMYAKLCAKLSNPLKENRKFNRLLLQRCVEDFEKVMKFPMEKEIYIGHMKFLGELFCVGLLSKDLTHYCVNKLFGDVENPDEKNIECLCTLMTIIGCRLEQSHKDSNNLELFEKYFNQFDKLSKSNKLPKRIFFMIKDLLDMRSNKWIARREKVKPMPLKAVQEKAEKDFLSGKCGKGGGARRQGVTFKKGQRVKAKYRPNSSYKYATVIYFNKDTNIVFVKFDGYNDKTPLPLERIFR